MLLSIFKWGNFPVCFIDGVGSTPFKIAVSCIILIIMVISAVILISAKKHIHTMVLYCMIGWIAATMASEVMFMSYRDIYEIKAVIGHVLKVISFYLIYKAIIEVGIRQPYNLLFFKLKQTNEQLKAKAYKQPLYILVISVFKFKS